MFTRAFYAPTQSCHLQNIFIWLPNVENKCNCLILLHVTAILSLPILIVLFKILVLQALFSLLIFRRGCRNMFLILLCTQVAISLLYYSNKCVWSTRCSSDTVVYSFILLRREYSLPTDDVFDSVSERIDTVAIINPLCTNAGDGTPPSLSTRKRRSRSVVTCTNNYTFKDSDFQRIPRFQETANII